MKKILVKIVGLSYSQSQIGSYIIVLGEKKGNKKIPIIIKPTDAQYIALKMESSDYKSNMVHDLLKSVTDALSAEITEVFIHDVVEGIFYCKVVLHDLVGKDYEIQCSVGDAIALSLTYQCPIYVAKEVIDTTGIKLTEDGRIIEDEEEVENDESVVTIDGLEKILKDALDNEDYEIASQLRDKINSLKEEEKK